MFTTTKAFIAGIIDRKDFKLEGTVLVKYTGKPINPRKKRECAITIPLGVTAIGKEAFRDCAWLTSITLPRGVTTIGEGAFRGCDGLTSITLPKGVTAIGNRAFQGCARLTSIAIPEGVPIVGFWTFAECTRLKNVTLPRSVTSAGTGSGAYQGCRGLTSITVDPHNSAYTSAAGVLFTKDGTVLLLYPRGRLERSYTIPETVTSIAARAFAECNWLAAITIHRGVTSIGGSGNAFYGCLNLASITVDPSNSAYMSIEGVLFTRDGTVLAAYPPAKNEQSYTIPPGVTSVGDSAFTACTKLTRLTIPRGVTSIGAQAFLSCWFTSITLPPGITSIGARAFAYTLLDSITIPPGVTRIGDEAFSNCYGLTRVTLPEGVISIGDEAFSDCDKLASITLPEGLKIIGAGAFFGCDELARITIPASLIHVGDTAFSDCTRLKEVRLARNSSLDRSLFPPNARVIEID